jgi:hypothetical protein
MMIFLISMAKYFDIFQQTLKQLGTFLYDQNYVAGCAKMWTCRYQKIYFLKFIIKKLLEFFNDKKKTNS